MKFKDIHWFLRLMIGVGIGYGGGYIVMRVYVFFL